MVRKLRSIMMKLALSVFAGLTTFLIFGWAAISFAEQPSTFSLRTAAGAEVLIYVYDNGTGGFNADDFELISRSGRALLHDSSGDRLGSVTLAPDSIVVDWEPGKEQIAVSEFLAFLGQTR